MPHLVLAFRSATKIFVDGMWAGIHHNPEEMVNTLRQCVWRWLGLGGKNCHPGLPCLPFTPVLQRQRRATPNDDGNADVVMHVIASEVSIFRDIREREIHVYTGQCVL